MDDSVAISVEKSDFEREYIVHILKKLLEEELIDKEEYRACVKTVEKRS